MKLSACSASVFSAIAWTLVSASGAQAATVLRNADIVIAIGARSSCDVQMDLEIETTGPTTIDHRLLLADDSSVSSFAVSGGGIVAARSQSMGRTLSLPLRMPGGGVHGYRLTYHVERKGGADRCPMWIPLTPTDGVHRSVQIRVQLPAGVDPLEDTFPSLTWNSSGSGSVTLGHIPAFVRTPFTSAATARSWRLSERRVVDLLAVGFLALVSIAWAVKKVR